MRRGDWMCICLCRYAWGAGEMLRGTRQGRQIIGGLGNNGPWLR